MNDIRLITFGHLSDLPELIHFQTTRHGGFSQCDFRGLNMSYSTGDNTHAVRRNRELVAEQIGLPLSSFVVAKQIHSDIIRHVTSDDRGKGAFCENQYALGEADALVCNDPQVVLCVRIADCIPIICYDPKRGVIAAIHAGWQGTTKRIAQKTIGVMCRNFGCEVGNILVGIGIGAGICCYEVGEEVFLALQASVDKLNNTEPTEWYREKPNGKYMVDLRWINRHQLEMAGIRSTHIESRKECTICGREMYFSFRGRSNDHFGQSLMGIALKK